MCRVGRVWWSVMSARWSSPLVPLHFKHTPQTAANSTQHSLEGQPLGFPVGRASRAASLGQVRGEVSELDLQNRANPSHSLHHLRDVLLDTRGPHTHTHRHLLLARTQQHRPKHLTHIRSFILNNLPPPLSLSSGSSTADPVPFFFSPPPPHDVQRLPEFRKPQG